MSDRTPEAIYEDIDALTNSFPSPKTSDPNFWEIHIAYQSQRAALWRELYEALLRTPSAPRWAFQAVGMVADPERLDAEELRRRAERVRSTR